MLAEAFVGQTNCDDPKHVDGILIRTDAPADLDNPEYYLYMIVHELAHIFCTTNEIESAPYAGQRFYDLNCAVEPTTREARIANGQMNAGYAIWRELIADIMTDIVDQQPAFHLSEIQDILRCLARDVKVSNPAAKACLSQYLVSVMNTWEGSEAETWAELKTAMDELHLPLSNIVQMIFETLHDGQCYEITPGFISDLGTTYMVEVIKNTPPDEITKAAQSFHYKYEG